MSRAERLRYLRDRPGVHMDKDGSFYTRRLIFRRLMLILHSPRLIRLFFRFFAMPAPPRFQRAAAASSISATRLLRSGARAAPAISRQLDAISPPPLPFKIPARCKSPRYDKCEFQR